MGSEEAHSIEQLEIFLPVAVAVTASFRSSGTASVLRPRADHGSDNTLPIFTPSVHRPPKSLPKRGSILLFRISLRSPFKSKIPPFLGRDLGGPCTEEVMKKLGISELDDVL